MPSFYSSEEESHHIDDINLNSNIETNILNNIKHSEEALAQHYKEVQDIENNIEEIITKNNKKIEREIKDIKILQEEVDKIPYQRYNQNDIIDNKNILLNTRQSMMKTYNNRNNYKVKIIYSTIALIIFIILILVVVYIYSNKTHITKNFNKNVALK